RLKTAYNPKVHFRHFDKGDLVLLYWPRRLPKRSPKWQLWYTGPFQVEKRLTDINYVVRRSPRANPQIVHVDKLKKYYGHVPSYWKEPTENAMVEPALPIPEAPATSGVPADSRGPVTADQLPRLEIRLTPIDQLAFPVVTNCWIRPGR